MNIVIQKKNPKSITKLNNAINKGDHVFIFISADWCGHCKTMKPEWAKLCKNKYGPNVVIANVNSDLHEEIQGFGPKAEGFPDLRYINKMKGIIEKYEDSGILNSERTYEAFYQWIMSKTKTGSNKIKTHKKGMVYNGGTRKQKNKRKQKKTKQNKRKQNKTKENKRQRTKNINKN